MVSAVDYEWSNAKDNNRLWDSEYYIYKLFHRKIFLNAKGSRGLFKMFG